MEKQLVKETINTLLNELSRKQKIYSEAATNDEILEVRKAIRVRIKELNEQLASLYQQLENLEN